MENASKALIIAGGVLVAIFILSIGVILYNNSAETAEGYRQIWSATQIRKFNSSFTIFELREDIVAQEIVTVLELAEEYEKEYIYVKVIVNDANKIGTINSIEDNVDAKKIIEFLQNNSADLEGDIINFKCISIEYSEDGKVDAITFKKL